MELKNKFGQTEKEFLAAYDSSKFEHPSVTADCVIWALSPSKPNLRLLLIKRGDHPSIGRWALAGGFVNPEETTQAAAARELQEETGLSSAHLEFVTLMSEPHRDPRTWVITTVYMTLLNDDLISAQAGDDAAEAEWFDVHYDLLKREVNETPQGSYENTTWELKLKHAETDLRAVILRQRKIDRSGHSTTYQMLDNVNLAFDHPKVIAIAIDQLRTLDRLIPRVIPLLNENFTIQQLNQLVDKVMGFKIPLSQLKLFSKEWITRLPNGQYTRQTFKK